MLLLELLNLYFLQSENLELRWRLYRQPVYNLDIYISMYLKHIIKYAIQNIAGHEVGLARLETEYL